MVLFIGTYRLRKPTSRMVQEGGFVAAEDCLDAALRASRQRELVSLRLEAGDVVWFWTK
jgi:hypothetical protein